MSLKSLLVLSVVSAAIALNPATLRADDVPTQSQPPTPPDGQAPPADGQTPPPPGHRHGGHRQVSLSELTLKLNLTADQQKSIGPIIANSRSQAKDLRADDSLSREDKHAKMKEIEETSRTQIRALLTADQQKIFDTLAHGPKPAVQSPDSTPSAPPSPPASP